MDKKTTIIIALLLAVGIASATNSYAGAETNSLAVLCFQSNFNNITGSIVLKVNAQLDRESFTMRNCLNGQVTTIPFNRSVWIKQNDLRPIVSLPRASMSDSYGMLFSNEKVWKNIFRTTTGAEIKSKQEYVTMRDSLISSPLDDANDHLAKNINTKTKISAEEMVFYYALAEEDPDGMNNYVTGTGIFASITSFRNALGFGYILDSSETHVSDNRVYSGINFSSTNTLRAAGHKCGAYYCVDGTKLDSELLPEQRSFFAFTDDINYYYYPMYIESLSVTIKGYDGNTSTKNQVYVKNLDVRPTSNVIKLRMAQTQSWLQRFFGIGFQRYDYKIYDIPDLGTELIIDQEVARLPSEVRYVTMEARLNLYPNPLYRHKSPVDFTYQDFWIRNCQAEDNLLLGFGYCDLGGEFYGFRSKYLVSFNYNTGTSNNTQTPSGGIDENEPNATTTNNYENGTESPQNTLDNTTSINGTPGVGWGGSDGLQGGSLENQGIYVTQLENVEKKGSFFLALQDMQLTIMEITILVYSVLGFALVVIMFLAMPSTAVRKTLREFKRLIRR